MLLFITILSPIRGQGLKFSKNVDLPLDKSKLMIILDTRQKKGQELWII